MKADDTVTEANARGSATPKNSLQLLLTEAMTSG